MIHLFLDDFSLPKVIRFMSSLQSFFITMESNSELSQSLFDFQQLLREGALPPKMQAKLRYLQASIAGREVQGGLSQSLPEFEKMSLGMMNPQTKLSLFVSIVRCLAGREMVQYFSAEKAWIKPEGSSSSSTKCYLFLDSNTFKISRNKDGKELYKQIAVDKLMVSKIYRQDKGKFSFAVGSEGERYRVKLQGQGVCARVHGELLKLVREKRNMKLRQEEKAREGLKLSQMKIEGRDLDEEDGEIDYEKYMIDEERQFLRSLIEKVEKEIENTDRFQLVKNTEMGKVLVDRVRSDVKVMVFMQKCTVGGLVESYMQFGAWNVQVQTFKIVNRIRKNTFLGYLKIKKQGMFSAPRETYLTFSYFKECKCLKQESKNQLSPQEQKLRPARHYLVINSIQSPSHHDHLGAVSMSFNQIVEFSHVQDRIGCVFMTVLSHMDFKLWGYLQSSLQLGLSFMEDVGAIALLCRQREMLKGARRQMFQIDACACTRGTQDKLQDVGSDRHRKLSMTSELAQSIVRMRELSASSNPVVTSLSTAWPLAEVLRTIDSHNRMIRTQRIAQLIKSQVYEKYYLRQRFPMASNEQPYISSGYSLKARNNFLSLGTSWKLTSSDEYTFINEQQLKLQKGVLKLIVKQVTANLMAGKSIMTMSLPVQIFDDHSALQSFAKLFGFVPVFMHKAVETDKVEEQIKYVAMSFLFMFACHPKVCKPFNPILGQTYEGVVGGVRVYFQQISHHPPVSTFFMKTDKFQAHGNIDIQVNLGLNSAHSSFPSLFYVKVYNTNSDYVIKCPDIEVSGVMFGDRSLRLSSRAFVLERRSGMYLQWSIGKQKKGVYEYKDKIRSADLAGGVFQITPEAVGRMLSLDKKKAVDGIKKEQVVRQYSLLSGKWFGQVMFDGVVYKSVKNGPFPLELERPSLLLPSDCTFRLDIVYKMWRDYAKSNEQKQVLQNLQRRERKLREKHHPSHH